MDKERQRSGSLPRDEEKADVISGAEAAAKLAEEKAGQSLCNFEWESCGRRGGI